MTVQDEFRAMCKAHDLTYSYSDDSNCWRSGEESLAKIKMFAMTHLTTEEAVRIWNSVVDTKLAEGYRDTFYARTMFNSGGTK